MHSWVGLAGYTALTMDGPWWIQQSGMLGVLDGQGGGDRGSCVWLEGIARCNPGWECRVLGVLWFLHPSTS